MENSDSRSSSEHVSEQQASAEVASSLAKNAESDREIFTEFGVLLEKFPPILIDIKDNKKLMDRPPIQKAIESIEKGLGRAKNLIKSTTSTSPIKQIEVITQDLGRSLGLVLFASIDASTESKQKIAALQKELMSAKFDSSFSPSPSPSANPSPKPDQDLGFVSELESEKEIEEERITLSIDDVVLQLKYGNDEEFRLALLGLSDFIRDKLIDNKWINDEDIIPVLFNRLGSSKPYNRLIIIQILRILASQSAENKVNHMRNECFFLCGSGFKFKHFKLLAVLHCMVVFRRRWQMWMLYQYW